MKRSELIALAKRLDEGPEKIGRKHTRLAAEALRQIAQMQPHGCDYEFDEHGDIVAKYPVYRLDLED